MLESDDIGRRSGRFRLLWTRQLRLPAHESHDGNLFVKRIRDFDEQLSYSRIVVLDEDLLQQIFDRNRRAGSDMQGDVLREREEFIGVGREIVAHGKLDEYADFALVAVALDVAIELVHGWALKGLPKPIRDAPIPAISRQSGEPLSLRPP